MIEDDNRGSVCRETDRKGKREALKAITTISDDDS
jgi:hypothetical protein